MTEEEQLFFEWLLAEFSEDEYNQYLQNLAENNIDYKTTEEYDSWKSLPVPQGGLGKPAPDTTPTKKYKLTWWNRFWFDFWTRSWSTMEFGTRDNGEKVHIDDYAKYRDNGGEWGIYTWMREDAPIVPLDWEKWEKARETLVDDVPEGFKEYVIEVWGEDLWDSITEVLPGQTQAESPEATEKLDTLANLTEGFMKSQADSFSESDAPSPGAEIISIVPAGVLDTAPSGIIEWSDGAYTTAIQVTITDDQGNIVSDYIPLPPDTAEQQVKIYELQIQNLLDELQTPAPAGTLPIEIIRTVDDAGITHLQIKRTTVAADGTETDYYEYLGQDTPALQEAIAERGMAVEEAMVEVAEGRVELDRDELDARLAQEAHQFETLSAYEQAMLDLSQLQWGNLSAAEQAQFDFDQSVFEQQKFQWQQEFDRDKFEFENLSAWQQAQQGIQLRDLGLQERIAQAEFQKRPMDWLAAWQFSNPTWSGVPRGTANPNAQPYIPIPEGGFQPSSQPMLGGNPPPTPMGGR